MLKIKFLKRLLMSLLSIYIMLCIAVYFFQESFIFFPKKLDEDYLFNFNLPVEELYLT